MNKEIIKTNHVNIWEAIFSASSFPESFNALEKMGKKDALNAPSANNFLIIFASLKLRLKASANIPAPRKVACIMSLIKQLILYAKVQPPTVVIFLTKLTVYSNH